MKSMTSLTSSGNFLNLLPQNLNKAPVPTLSSYIVSFSTTQVNVEVTLNLPFPPLNHNVFKTKLQVTLPSTTANFILTDNSACTVTSVNTISFTCAVSDKTNGILQVSYTALTLSSSATWSKLTDQTLTIVLTNVNNPASMKPTPEYSIASLTNTNNFIQQNASPYNPVSTLTTPNTLTNVKVERNSDSP